MGLGLSQQVPLGRQDLPNRSPSAARRSRAWLVFSIVCLREIEIPDFASRIISRL